jgi:DNA-binding IclR family transcriptional regulator
MSKYAALLRALAEKTGGRAVSSQELADALGMTREQAVRAASGLLRKRQLEAGPKWGTYTVAVELLPEPKPPKPPKRRAGTRDGQRVDPAAHATPSVLTQDFPILDLLDEHGALTTADVRRLAQSSFNVSPSLERLRMAGLVRLDGLRWVVA